VKKIGKESIILGGLGIFAVGVILGTKINYGSLINIEGFKFNRSYAYSTDSNATSSNATSCNATSSNSTAGNATACNATSSNVSLSDNILYLDYFYVFNDTVSVGENVKLDIVTSGANLIGVSIVVNNNLGNTYTLIVQSIDNKPYISIPKTLVESTYNVTDVLLIAENSDGSTFTKHYSSNKAGDGYYYNFNTSFKVKKSSDTTEDIVLNNISLKSNISKVNDKVYLNIDTNVKLTNLKLQFSSKSMSFNVNVKSVNDNPYFVIPSNVDPDTYELTMATLTSSNSSVLYSNTKSSNNKFYKFNTTLKIENNENGNTYSYNNEDVTNEIISKLYSDNNVTEIEINADSNSIISADLFNSIKGTNKKIIFSYNDNQLIFNGKDIISAKSVDVSISVNPLVSDSDINKLVSNGVVVNFAENGNLPGEALVRINSSKVNTLLNDSVSVYYYKDDTNKFTLIAENISKTSDGYYEFSISHNSKYILVNSKLDSNLIDTVNENLVSFQRDNKINYALIIVGGLLAISVGTLIIVLSAKNKKNEE